MRDAGHGFRRPGYLAEARPMTNSTRSPFRCAREKTRCWGRYFVAVAAVIAIATYISYLLATIGISVDDPFFLTKSSFRFKGLMDNAVPFSWLILSAIALQLAFQKHFQADYPRLNVACGSLTAFHHLENFVRR